MTKAKFIYEAFDPELPDFPLPANVIEEAQGYDGPMPTSFGEWVDMLTAERLAATPDEAQPSALRRP